MTFNLKLVYLRIFSGAAQSAKQLLLMLILPLVLTPSVALAQAKFTAERRLAVQVGGTVSFANSGMPRGASVLYGTITGGGLYGTIDLHPRWGVEVAARYLADKYISERAYLVGPRYFRPYRRYTPYAKALVGRGVFKFPDAIGEISVPTVAFGGGLDYRAAPTIQFRVDYEYQRWIGFGSKVTNFPGALAPQALSFGVSYLIR